MDGETFEGVGMGMFIFVHCAEGFMDVYTHLKIKCNI